MNKEQAKKLLKEDIEFIQSLSTAEYTLYRNWTHKNTNKMKKWFKENRYTIELIRRRIWTPKNTSDYENLNIEVIPAEGEYILHWRILREFIHTAVWHASPGFSNKEKLKQWVCFNNPDSYYFK